MQDALFDLSANESAASQVYVIGAAESSIVKIGKANNVKKRLAGLQTSNPNRLVVRWTTPGAEKLEGQLHNRFNHLRLEGEWFDFGTQDPVEAVRIAVAELTGAAKPVEPAVPLEFHGPFWDIRRPRPDDPDHSNPIYQPTSRGCRCWTPKELAEAGYADEDCAIWCFCDFPGHYCGLNSM